jgi:hypothetical protein
MTIYDYIKLSEREKEMILRSDALYLEFYAQEETLVYVYFLNGFFVEVTMKNGEIVDNIPYKRGYKFSKREMHSLEKRNVFHELKEQVKNYMSKNTVVNLNVTKAVKARMIRMLLIES